MTKEKVIEVINMNIIENLYDFENKVKDPKKTMKVAVPLGPP